MPVPFPPGNHSDLVLLFFFLISTPCLWDLSMPAECTNIFLFLFMMYNLVCVPQADLSLTLEEHGWLPCWSLCRHENPCPYLVRDLCEDFSRWEKVDLRCVHTAFHQYYQLVFSNMQKFDLLMSHKSALHHSCVLSRAHLSALQQELDLSLFCSLERNCLPLPSPIGCLSLPSDEPFRSCTTSHHYDFSPLVFKSSANTQYCPIGLSEIVKMCFICA